jgi:hypothetical protein
MNFELFHNDDIRVEYCDGTRRDIQRVLDDCREERRPYLVIKNDELRIKNDSPADTENHSKFKIQNSKLTSILVPVSMLEEEVYKAEICTYLARKTGAHLILLRARDYGSKAKQNTQRIITHIQTIAERTGKKISYEEQVAKRDSFSFHKDFHNGEWKHDLLLLTASREYGLDDWLFGPPELYAIRKSEVPVMLVNPRADLFSLCD